MKRLSILALAALLLPSVHAYTATAGESVSNDSGQQDAAQVPATPAAPNTDINETTNSSLEEDSTASADAISPKQTEGKAKLEERVITESGGSDTAVDEAPPPPDTVGDKAPPPPDAVVDEAPPPPDTVVDDAYSSRDNQNEPAASSLAKDEENGWFPLQIALWNPIQITRSKRNIYGLRLGIGYARNQDVWGIDIGAIFNRSRNTTGIQLNSFINFADENARGIQFAAFGNIIKRNSVGLQLGGIFNWNGETTYGIQVGSIFNYSKNGGVGGIQLASIFNRAGGKSWGIQVAGIINYAHSISGLQIAFLNGAVTEMNGIQIGFMNTYKKQIGQFGLFTINRISTKVTGAQLSWYNETMDVIGVQIGLIGNIAHDDLRGLQVGGFNFAEDAAGVQIGLFNFASELRGVQLGLVNIITEGKLKFFPGINFSTGS